VLGAALANRIVPALTRSPKPRQAVGRVNRGHL
jgi:hypothetical protein